ncbi:hypothetical protein IMSHALPRED_008380 [Imshaugia aleurites]|uniref:Uncharacterized protein n=1 Tax=Imshaugia aleurites TaxID=172621 RepID=A0A8H3EQD8_9LECA|nr:hypothetical protein IMSHALPRED_008380 [Imshaugia aleurites]
MLLDKDPRWVRLVLRIYFNVAFAFFAIIGNQCVVYATKLQILEKRSVNVTRMTNWLLSIDPVKYLLQTGRLPAGWLGGLMIICAALSFVSDLAVSSLIRPVQVSTRCPFSTGLVSPTSQPLTLIPVNGSPYTVTSNAQLSSIANGGPIGIYWKVNEDRDFQAQPEDIAGGWVCDDLDQDEVYQPDSSQADIVEDLINKGLLFNTTPISEYSDGNGSFNHYVILTSSQADASLHPFDVRASVQLDALFDDVKTMKSLECTMNAPAMEWVLANASSQKTLSEWILTFQGSMYNGTGTTAAPDVDARLEWVLNSMVMIGAGGNYLLSVAPPDSTQGCLAQRALIPNAMLAIFGIVTLILIAIPFHLAFLFFRYRRFSSINRSLVKATPNSLVGWMVQAARITVSDNGNRSGHEVKSKDLKHWEYGLRGAGEGRPRLFRKDQTLTDHDEDESIELVESRRE